MVRVFLFQCLRHQMESVGMLLSWDWLKSSTPNMCISHNNAYIVCTHLNSIHICTHAYSCTCNTHIHAIAAVIAGSSIVVTVAEDHRPAIISLSQKRTVGSPTPLTLTQTDSGRRLEKLSSVDPKVCLPLPSPPPPSLYPFLFHTSFPCPFFLLLVSYSA